MDNLANAISRYLYRQSSTYKFLVREAKTDEGFLTLVWGLRFVVLLALIFRFGINWEDYSDSTLSLVVQLTVLVYFLYILLLGYLRAFKFHLFVSRECTLLQIGVDIVAFSIFYFLIKDVQSDVFILYFLPLIIAARYFGSKITLIFFAATTLAVSTVVLSIATFFVASPQQMFGKIFVPRQVFFAIIIFAYLLLYEQARRRMQELASLREASEAVNSTLNMNDVLRLILDQLREVVPYDSASIQLIIGNNSKVIACRGFKEPDKVLKLAFPLEDPQFPNYHVFMKGEPHIVDDVRLEYEHFYKEPEKYQAAHIRSWLGVPLISKDRVIGMMTLDNSIAGFYDDDHACLAEIFAAQAATAIENAGLYEQAQQKVSELIALRKSGLEMVSSLQLGAVLNAIAESALKLIVPNDVFIFLYDEATGQFTFGTSLWASGERGELITMPRKDGLTARVARQGELLVINDAEHHPLYSSSDAPRRGVKAIAGFPLKRAGKVLGVLNVTFLEPHTFNEDELRILAMLADQAAIAIDNAQLYQQTIHRLDILSRLYKTITALRTNLDLNKTLNLIIDNLQGLFNLDTCTVGLFDPEQTQLNFIAQRGIGKPVTRLVKDLPPDLVERVLANDRPIVIEDLNARPDLQKVLVRKDLTFFTVLPLHGKKKPLGIITMSSVNSMDLLPEEIELLKALASQAAIAIENSHLFAQLADISEVSKEIVSILDLDKLLHRVVELIRENFGYRYTTVLLVDPARGELVLKAGTGYPAKDLEERLRLKIGRKGITAWVAYSGEPFLVNDVDREPRYYFIKELKDTKSELAVPLKLKDRVIGVLDVESSKLNAFDESDIFVLRTVADQIAIAIENARKMKELSHLREVGQDISEITDLKEVLCRIVKSANEVIKADISVIIPYDAEKHQFRTEFAAADGNWDKEFIFDKKFRPEGITAIVMGEPKGLIAIENLDEHPTLISEFAKREEVKAVAVARLEVRDEVVGVLYVDFRRIHHFSDEELETIWMFANQAAIAIKNALLFDEAQRRVHELATLQDISMRFWSSAIDLESMLNIIVDSAVAIIPAAKRGVIHLLDNVTGELHPEASFGMDISAIGKTKMRLGEGIAGYALKAGKIMNIPDTETEKGFYPTESNGHIKSLLVAPLIAGGEKIGTLSVDSERVDAFATDDERLLATLATQAAVIIRLYRRISEVALEKERERLQGDLHEAMNIFHAAVMLRAEIIKDKLRKGEYKVAEIGLEQLWRASRFAYTELDNILQDLRSPILEEEGLVPALRAYAQTVEREYVFVEGDAQVRLPVEVEHALYRIGQGAISNALKHAGLDDIEGGRVQVKMTVESGIVTLSIEDNGMGFDIDTLERRGDWFGLRRMEERAKSIGGRLEIQSVPEQGTTVTVTVALEGASSGA